MASSTVALGRTLIANQILAANEKGDTKITLKILASGAVGAIISVANTKGQVKGYIQNPDLDYKRTSTGEVIVGPLVGNGQFLVITDYGTGHPYNSMTPLISGEIGEDFAYFLTDSQQTPSAVGLNVLLDEEDKVKVAGGFLLQVLPGATEAEIARFEKRIKKCLPSPACWLLKTILKLCYPPFMATTTSNACQKKKSVLSATALKTASSMLWLVCQKRTCMR